VAPTETRARFTESSQNLSAFFTDPALCRQILTCMRNNSRADMHVHSTASELSKLGVQRSLGLPECATPPEEVYELAKRRGMDFVTITDHDTIDGALQISDLPDVFVSEELTVSFKGEPQAVHVLCYGIDGADHEWLQTHNDDVEACAAYLDQHEITAALARPTPDRLLVAAQAMLETCCDDRLPTSLQLPAETSISGTGRPSTSGRSRDLSCIWSIGNS